MTQEHHISYANSIELLKDEIEGWMTARCHHLAAKHELAEAAVPTTRNITVLGREDVTAREELRRRIAILAVEEADIRAEIDARIEATKATGIDLSLVRLCRELDLDPVERATLLLTFAPTLGERAIEPLEQIGLYRFGIDPSISLVAQFCELTFADRVGLHMRFGAEGRLVREGLIAVDVGRSAFPADWPSASLKLTNQGFAALTGLQVPGDDAEE